MLTYPGMYMIHKGSWLANDRDVIDAVKDYDYDLGCCVEKIWKALEFTEDCYNEVYKENEELEFENEQLKEELEELKKFVEERDKELEKEYKDFKDIWTDGNTNLISPWFIIDTTFDKGVSKYEIEEWFDERHSKGIEWLKKNVG